jgi:tetratricopeptide (TPR) repeat protein
MAGTPPQTLPPRSPRRPADRSARHRLLAIAGVAAFCPLGAARAAPTCEAWSAEVSSVEGRVDIRRSATSHWVALAAGEHICRGDLVHVEDASRATFVLPDGGVFKLDEDSTLNLPEPPSGVESLLELLRGIIHVISRDPRSLSFRTPYANAGLEGTEFDIRVDDRERLTEIVVLEGEVVVTTPNGRVNVASNHVAVAPDGQAPMAVPIDKPIERMRWASYYAPLTDRPLPAPGQEPLPAQRNDADFYADRAAANLTTARLDAAEADIASALRLAPGHPTALSLRALLLLARADRDAARASVAEALAGDPSSVVARVAASYVEQSANDLAAAERLVREALAIKPAHAIALTRAAELALARDDTATAIASATRARALAPNRSAPLVVLGFASLRAFDTAAAEEAFRAAVDLEPDAPLPRLGLSLTLIRRGDYTAGRRQLELAVAADPANPLTRSYMSAAYGADNRVELTASQLELAQQFDSSDPTAWLYSALQKLRSNRPVEAVQDFRLAARKNGDEPVRRSRLPLDEDLATRSAALGRIYAETGFGQLALLDAWQILGDDPADFTGHRLLADAYANEPRHELARVSELLVSQLLQPTNIAPIKPQLGQENLVLAQRAGPSSTSFDEFDSPVVANGLKLRASAASGGNGIGGHDVSLAGLRDRVSYSAGVYRFTSDGFRDNNDYQQEVGNAFVQYRPTYNTSLQAELRSARTEHGDLTTFFYRDVYSPLLRYDEDADSLRLGAKQQITPEQTLLGSVIYQDVLYAVEADQLSSLRGDQRAYHVDLQHIYDAGGLRIQSGVLSARQDEDIEVAALQPGGPPVVVNEEQANRQVGVYTYAYFDPVPSLTVTAGVSLDRIDNRFGEEEAANPKIGIVWRPTAHTTLRAAALETLYGSLSTSTQNAQPRLEPVQVAGFTQLLFGGATDKTTLRGLAIEQEVSSTFLIGLQADERVTERTGANLLVPTGTTQIDLEERTREAYLYWMPSRAISVSARYEHGNYSSAPAQLGYSDMDITRLPVELRYFSRGGFTIGARASHVDQRGEFQSGLQQTPSDPPPLAYGEDQFWVLDAFVGYRLPNRRGLLSLNADNLLDESFQFQDIDPTNPSLFPERLISFRFTLAFE